MNEILQTLDESIFSAEIKETILSSFNEAVDAKVKEEVESLFESRLTEAKKEVELELSERLDEYLNQIVNDWVDANSLVMESEVKASKLDALIEGFEAMLIAGGIDALKIQEAKEEIEDDEDEDELDDEDEENECKMKEGKKVKKVKMKENDGNDEDAEEDDTEYNESIKGTLNRLMKENIDLKKEKESLIIKGFLAEESIGMTEIQKEKFFKLAESLDKSDKEKFIADLDLIKESIIKVEEVIVAESVKDEVKADKYVSKAKHLY